MNLAQMQRNFRAWLVTASDTAAGQLGTVTSAGLAVYQNNYRGQLVGCLEEAFTHVRSWIGEETFRNAAITHIDSRPPHSWTLDAYASGFGETLVELFPRNPDLHELAWIEWSLSQSFVAADAEPLSPQALALVDWDTARLRLTPSLMCHVATTNAERIWSALWEKTEVPEGQMLPQPGGLIVWRRGFTSRLKQVEALELEVLLELQGDGRFAALCDRLVERLGEAEGIARAGSLLADWLGAELIVGID